MSPQLIKQKYPFTFVGIMLVTLSNIISHLYEYYNKFELEKNIHSFIFIIPEE